MRAFPQRHAWTTRMPRCNARPVAHTSADGRSAARGRSSSGLCAKKHCGHAMQGGVQLCEQRMQGRRTYADGNPAHSDAAPTCADGTQHRRSGGLTTRRRHWPLHWQSSVRNLLGSREAQVGVGQRTKHAPNWPIGKARFARTACRAPSACDLYAHRAQHTCQDAACIQRSV